MSMKLSSSENPKTGLKGVRCVIVALMAKIQRQVNAEADDCMR